MEATHLNGPSEGRFARLRSSREKIEKLMLDVCYLAGVDVKSLRGTRQSLRLVNARSVVAVLAHEFYPELAADLVADVLLRGKGWTQWARERSRDRMALYPEYKLILDYCRSNIERLS